MQALATRASRGRAIIMYARTNLPKYRLASKTIASRYDRDGPRSIRRMLCTPLVALVSWGNREIASKACADTLEDAFEECCRLDASLAECEIARATAPT